jgi:hypothetical protein
VKRWGIRLGGAHLAAVQFFDSVGGDLHRRALAGIINIRGAIQRSIEKCGVSLFGNGIRVDGRPA